MVLLEQKSHSLLQQLLAQTHSFGGVITVRSSGPSSGSSGSGAGATDEEGGGGKEERTCILCFTIRKSKETRNLRGVMLDLSLHSKPPLLLIQS